MAFICHLPRVLVCGLLLASRFLASAQEASAVPPSGLQFLDDGFCSSSSAEELAAGERSFDIGDMSCEKIMELVYIARQKVSEQLDEHLRQANTTSKPPPAVDSIRASSRASSLLSAHAHIIVAVASQRSECFSEHIRLLLTVSLRRMKQLATGQVQQLWHGSQAGLGGEKQEELIANRLKEWLEEASGLLDADLRTLKTVLSTWKQPNPEEARFYSHEADGRYSTMEALRRDTFEEWTLDKGLLQALIRDVFPLDAVVADFGAGSGHYSRWLNDTGIVTALAFDGSPDINLVTRGTVASVDLGRPLSLWRRFDWTLCLEVAENIPAELTPEFLKNLDQHTADGLVISWAKPGLQGLGTANPLTQEQALALIKEHTGLKYLDEDLTKNVRSKATAPHLADTVLVMVRKPPKTAVVNLPGSNAAPGCAAEEGWIYAGNDVQMFNAVTSAAACCELCNSNDQCRFWTWSREDSHKELCWIKATREYRINHEGFISGTRDGS